jgi:hypothetical protein
MRYDGTNIANSQDCERWETLLADALDGRLNPEDEAAFTAHTATCAACSALMEDARKGREWLGYLAPEPEIPVDMISKILARTGPGQAADQGLPTGAGGVLPMPPIPAMVPDWNRGSRSGRLYQMVQPQLLMTVAMAFFSIALTLNLTGFSVRDLNLASLRPGAVRSVMERRLSEASTPIVRYYDHLLLVCQVEARSRVPRLGTQGEDRSNSGAGYSKPRQLTPGESKALPSQRGNGHDADQRQTRTEEQYNSNDLLESSLNPFNRYAPLSGSAKAIRERSTVWTA